MQGGNGPFASDLGLISHGNSGSSGGSSPKFGIPSYLDAHVTCLIGHRPVPPVGKENREKGVHEVHALMIMDACWIFPTWSSGAISFKMLSVTVGRQFSLGFSPRCGRDAGRTAMMTTVAPLTSHISNARLDPLGHSP